MPRLPKSVRDAMKTAGEWDFEPSPPPFDPVEAFCSSESMVPMPGAYEAHLDFMSPPDATFENGPLFGDIPEEAIEALGQELPGAGVFQSMGFDGEDVVNRVFSVAHVAAAVQMASAHQGLCGGPPALAELSRIPVGLPSLVSSYVHTMGEFSGPDERRWLYNDFQSEIDVAIRSACQLDASFSWEQVRSKGWLPVRVDDGRCAALVASRLETYFSDRGFRVPASELIGTVFSGDVPPTVAAIVQQLPSCEVLPLRELFKTFSTDLEFFRRFSAPRGQRAISLLGFEWNQPSRSDLGFSFCKVSAARAILLRWSVVSTTFQSALGVTFKVVSYHGSGDPWQAFRCVDRPGGVCITSHYALDARGASYAACFGTPVFWCSVPMRMTVIGRVNPRPLRVSLIRSHFGLV